MEGSKHGKVRPIRIERLYDLGAKNRLYADCPDCQWSSELDMKALAGRFGNARLDWIKDRLKCSQCGRKPCGMRQIWTLEPLEDWPPEEAGVR